LALVGQIIPWNFPLLMAAWKLGPALAAGCTVVLKPAEQTPLSALRLGDLIMEAGFPDGVVNIVPGYGETAGAALAAHDLVDKDRLHRIDRSRQAHRSRRHRQSEKVSLELGGKSPNVVFKDSDLDGAIPARPAPSSSITDNAAAPVRASTSSAPSTIRSSKAWPTKPRKSKSVPAWMPARKWARSFPKSNSTASATISTSEKKKAQSRRGRQEAGR
jgi:hypothetical protein